MKNFKEWCLENKTYEMLEAYENAQNECKSDEIGFSGSKKVNWKCTKCGMEWKATTNRMNRRKNVCVYCAHEKASPFYNLKTEVPLLAKQWHYEKNEKNPTEYFPLSEENVWWKCENGHVWKSSICNSVKSSKKNISRGRPICPYCNHEKVSFTYNLVTEFPDIAKQWNYKMNAPLTPFDVSPKSNKKVWWTCEYDPTHIWKVRISARTLLSRGCNICSKIIKASFPEQALYYYLKLNFDNCEIGKEILDKYILDIFIPDYNIIIEYDGWYYHSDNSSKIREKKRDKRLADFNIIRIKETKEEMEHMIWDDNILRYHPQSNYSNLDEVIKEILKFIEKKTNVKMQYDVDIKRDSKQIRTIYYHTRKAKSLAVKKPELAKEWSSNNDRTPDNVTLGSSYRAKWICPKCNREYTAIVSNRVKQNTNCPFCTNHKVCKENSLAYCSPELVKEWNYEKNGDLLPEDVIAGSGKKVWWKCENGHEWQTYIYARTGKKKVGCPYCSKTYVTAERSLEVKRPELKDIWNYEKNDGKTPRDYFASSNKKVWWKCKKGHEWQMAINKIHRIKSENKCPYCRNIKLSKDNSLAVLYKDISKQWDYEKNEKKPTEYLPSSKEKVWWKCKEGHEWQAMIYTRVKGCGCPYCKGVRASSKNSLKDNRKDLLKQWNYEKNDVLPENISICSGKKVWWKCENDHEWQASVAHRNIGRGCPYCSGRRVTRENSIVVTCPRLLKEWNYEKNGDLKPEQVSKGSGKKVWWKCECGHEWQASVVNRSRGRNCPICWEKRHRKKK